MFDQLIESGGMQIPSRKPLSLTLAVLIHGLMAGLLLIFPMLFPQTLVRQLDQFVEMVAPHIPPPLGPSTQGNHVPKPAKSESAPIKDMVQPNVIPPSISQLMESPELPAANESPNGPLVQGGEPGNKGGGIPGGMWGGDPDGRATVPRPPQPVSVKPDTLPIQRIKVSIGVQAAKLMWKELPDYPALAGVNRIQGSVVLSAVISPDGGIEELRVLSGHPLLIRSALEAVRKWRYRPTLLNGEPVRVETTIVVNFLLHGS
jgi:protein TonB